MDDITIAQQIIGNHYSNLKNTIYHNTSFIYTTSNEKMNLYQPYLQNKEKSLSIISSGDQILNLILSGCKQITGYDISRFTKYFLELKKAAIISLSREDFIHFFFDITHTNDDWYDEIYDQIRVNLEKEDREFWDSLINFYDWSEINQSTLFSSQTMSFTSILQNNDYLKEENYSKLKNMISKVNYEYYIEDIQVLVSKLKSQYYFINLSSIMYYISHYKDLLSKLPLKENGIALTYLYQVKEELMQAYPEGQMIPFDKSYPKEGIMIYKKH